MKKTVLVAHDVVPSQAFELLGGHLNSMGRCTELHLAFANGFDRSLELMRTCLKDAGFLLLGLASDEERARFEISMAEAACTENVPFGFLSDTFGVYAGRTRWLPKDLRERTSLIFVVSRAEVLEARALYPRARVIASGNPTWAAFYEPIARDAARKKLEWIKGQRYFVVPWGKDCQTNIIHGSSVLNALLRLPFRAHATILMHPGDKTESVRYSEAFRAYSPELFEIKKCSREHASLALAGADVVIESNSQMGIEAMARRIPTITYISRTAANRIAEQTSNPVPAQCRGGASLHVTEGSSRLREGILDLLGNSATRAAQRYNQEELLPRQDLSVILARMSAAIKDATEET